MLARTMCTTQIWMSASGQLDPIELAGGLASAIFAPLTATLGGRLDWRITHAVRATILALVTIPAHAIPLRAPWPPAPAAVGNVMTIADGGYPGTRLVMPHRRRKDEKLPGWKRAHNKSHKQVRARVGHAIARMKTWKILRDCRLKGDGVHHAMLGSARLHNLALAG